MILTVGMLQQFLLLVTGTYLVGSDPVAVQYNLTFEFTSIARLHHVNQYLHLVHFCLGMLLIVSRRFTFLSNRFSLQDIFLGLWLCLLKPCMRIFTGPLILLAFAIWDVDSYCLPFTMNKSRQIKFTFFKGVFLAASLADYVLFSTIPISAEQRDVQPYYPHIHIFLTVLANFLTSLFSDQQIILGLRIELILSTVPIAVLESFLLYFPDLNGLVHATIANLVFYGIIYFVTNVRSELEIDPLHYSTYANPFILGGLCVFLFQMNADSLVIFLLITCLKTVLVVKATKRNLPIPPDPALHDPAMLDEMILDRMVELNTQRKTDFRVLQLFYSIIVALLMVNSIKSKSG